MPTRSDERDVSWLAALLGEAARSEIMPRFRRRGPARPPEDERCRPRHRCRRRCRAADRPAAAGTRARRPGRGRGGLRRRSFAARRPGRAGLAFVVEPVDGTFNFASGGPLFGVTLAVVVRGEAVAGLILDPMAADCMIGVRGASCHLHHADGRIEPMRVAAGRRCRR